MELEVEAFTALKKVLNGPSSSAIPAHHPANFSLSYMEKI